jgi:hypothetical protein
VQKVDGLVLLLQIHLVVNKLGGKVGKVGELAKVRGKDGRAANWWAMPPASEIPSCGASPLHPKSRAILRWHTCTRDFRKFNHKRALPVNVVGCANAGKYLSTSGRSLGSRNKRADLRQSG